MARKSSGKAKRLASIVLMLKASTSLTAEELASSLGVTVRTLYRDLEELASAGIPICGTPGPEGGYQLAEYFPVDPFVYVQADPPPLLTKASVRVPNELNAAAHVLAEVLPQPLRDSFERLRERLLFDSSAWFWHDAQRLEFTEIKRAVLEDETVEIAYTGRASPDIQDAIVDPYGLVWKQGHWYLVAWSRVQKQFERYRLRRIIAVRRTGGKFERRPDFDLTTEWARLLERFGKGATRVRIRIDYPATKDFEAFIWKEDQHIVKYSDHWIVEMIVDSDEWLIPLVLSYGDKLRVLEPPSLRDRVVDAHESALNAYRPSSDANLPSHRPSSRRHNAEESTPQVRRRS